jgi:hypothetical protein
MSNTPQGGAIEGNAADDALMVDQGGLPRLTDRADSYIAPAQQRNSIIWSLLSNKEEVRVMRRLIVVMFCTFGLLGVLFGTAFAAHETGHYSSGVEGIKAATLPPPGLYYRLYNVFYNADELMDPDGDELPIGFEVSVYAMVNRFVCITNKKFLGADFGADFVIPLIYTDIEIKGTPVDDDQFGLGDIFIEPFVLSWHGPRYDASFGLGAYVPTGEYDKDKPASPGKDMWTGMLTLGGTYYFDAGKTWSASILGRYETHSEKDETDVTPGDDFHFEWGIGKTLAKVWDVGLTGYCHWQVTDDSGSGVTGDKSVHDRVYAIGPEVSVFIPPAKLFASLRSQWEFGAEDRSEGNVTTLTLTKIF